MQPVYQRLHDLLRWSEKYTKTDMVYLAGGGFWLSLGTVASALSSFILSIAFANLIPPAAYGIYKYVLSLASVFNAFTLTGLETAVIEAVSRGKEGVLRQAFWTNLVWSIPVAIVATGGAGYYFLNGNIILGFSLLFIALVQPLTVSVSMAAAFLNGKKAFRITAGYYAIDNLFPTAVLVAVMLVSQNILWIISVYFLSNLLVTVLMYWYVTWSFKPDNSAKDPTALTYAKHLSAMNVLANVADNFDKILTFQMLGPAPLAVYSFALALPSQTKLITKPLFNLIFPKFAERPTHELRQAMEEKTLRFFLAGVAMVVGYILIAPYVFGLIYPNYIDAVFLSQIYAVSMLGFVSAPMSVFLTAKRKVRAQYVQNIATSIFQLASAVVGILLGGLLGLIIARVATRFLGTFIIILFYYTDRSGE